MKKKLQVFVSSTYTDLIEERQAAVEAILGSKHIPAGMELFRAGNDSQLVTIKKWIDESDVYMLILGGRYGSIEEKTGKSYTQIEYEYALEKEIPIFTVVLSDSFLFQKQSKDTKEEIFEQSNKEKYDEFKALVMSKIIKLVDDCKDIKIAIKDTLSEFLDELELIGWVKGDAESSNNELIKENTRLVKENMMLFKDNQSLQKQLEKQKDDKIGEYNFNDLLRILSDKKITIPKLKIGNEEEYDTSLLNFFERFYNNFCTGISDEPFSPDEDIYVFHKIAPLLFCYNLLERINIKSNQRFLTSKLGNKFYAMLQMKKDTK